MKKLALCVAFATLVSPAFAQQPAAAPPSDTLKEVTTRGIVLTAAGMEIPVKYTPDGKFSAMDGAVVGEWRIDGDKLCGKSNMQPVEECIVYPLGKKSGDTFEVMSAQGPGQIKIN